MSDPINCENLPVESRSVGVSPRSCHQVTSHLALGTDPALSHRLDVISPASRNANFVQSECAAAEDGRNMRRAPNGTGSGIEDLWFAEDSCPEFSQELFLCPLDSTRLSEMDETPTPSIASHRATGELSLDGLTFAEIEKLAITQTLQRCAGNRTRAARMLGISVRTLQRKLRKWKVTAQ